MAHIRPQGRPLEPQDTTITRLHLTLEDLRVVVARRIRRLTAGLPLIQVCRQVATLPVQVTVDTRRRLRIVDPMVTLAAVATRPLLIPHPKDPDGLRINMGRRLLTADHLRHRARPILARIIDRATTDRGRASRRLR